MAFPASLARVGSERGSVGACSLVQQLFLMLFRLQKHAPTGPTHAGMPANDAGKTLVQQIFLMLFRLQKHAPTHPRWDACQRRKKLGGNN